MARMKRISLYLEVNEEVRGIDCVLSEGDIEVLLIFCAY
jgi:hypothetical protein